MTTPPIKVEGIHRADLLIGDHDVVTTRLVPSAEAVRVVRTVIISELKSRHHASMAEAEWRFFSTEDAGRRGTLPLDDPEFLRQRLRALDD